MGAAAKELGLLALFKEVTLSEKLAYSRSKDPQIYERKVTPLSTCIGSRFYLIWEPLSYSITVQLEYNILLKKGPGAAQAAPRGPKPNRCNRGELKPVKL